MTQEEVRDFLDEHAGRSENVSQFNFRKWYMGEFGPPYGSRILDVGGYVGATAIHYAKMGHRVTCIEGAKIYADEAAKNAELHDVFRRVDVRNCLFEEFSEPNAYDAACCTEVLGQVLDTAVVVSMIYDSLKDGGMAFLTVAAPKSKYDRRRLVAQDLYNLLIDAGFESATCWEWDDGMHTPQHMARGVK